LHTLDLNTSLSKEGIYQALLPQLDALCEGEKDTTANLANIAASLKQAFNWWWVGVYLVKNDELVVGPFQGPVACTRIAKGKGVCGASWEMKQTIIVPDVHAFAGHIACSSESNSEIVVPIIKDDVILGVIDADSQYFNHFDECDKLYLQKIAQLVAKLL
jgi:L-methionine (R)-S-oxide reductase